MAIRMTGDLDALTALLHARLAIQHTAACPVTAPSDRQRELLHAFADELDQLHRCLARHEARWLATQRERFDIENLKVLLRGLLAGARQDETRALLLPLPAVRGFDADRLLAATSPAELATRLPRGPFRNDMIRIVRRHAGARSPFLIEGALDRLWHERVLAATLALAPPDRSLVLPWVVREIDHFHTMLVLRGRVAHGMDAGTLQRFHVRGTSMSAPTFRTMLTDGAVPGAADDDPAAVETLAGRDILRLAWRAVRTSHTGFAVVAGYVAIRRIEVANLITIDEGTRMGLPEDVIRTHLIERSLAEAPHA